MASEVSNSSAEDNWRLEFELDVPDKHRSLHGLIGRVREPQVVQDVEASVPDDVVVTHDGSRLFAYAADEATLEAARGGIEGVMRSDGVTFSARVSRWDGERDEWRQTDPPLTGEQQAGEEARERDEGAIETRTLVATSGKLIRSEFEQTMLNWAAKLGVECEIVEHPHLLTTQVAFTVTGPKRRIDEFSKGLTAEGWTFVRTEGGLMADPL